MKANAIARIIIWSIVLVFLCGVLLIFVVNDRISIFGETALQTEVPAASLSGTVTADTPIYSSPDTKSNVVGNMVAGDKVDILRQETSDGSQWALTTFGWVQMSDIQIELTTGPVAVSQGESVSLGAVGVSRVNKLEIQWAAGSVTLVPGESTDTIRFWDDYSGDERFLLYYAIQGDTLKIQFCEAGWEDLDLGIRVGNSPEKNLTVEIPQGWNPEEVELEVASARIEVHNLTLRNVDIEAASGAVGFENCALEQLDIDTASADVIYTGTLEKLDCDSASATVVLNLTNVPKSLDMDAASGNLDITLPENAGFSAKLDSLSGNLHSDFDCDTTTGRYVCGDGACRIQANALSGNVYIRKSGHHAHTDTCTSDPSSCPEKNTETHHTEKHHN